MTEIFAILLAGLISENYALLEFLGTGAVVENRRSSGRSLLLGLGATLVMVISTAATWALNKAILHKYHNFQIMAYVIVIMIVADLIHLVASKLFDGYCRADFITFAINGAVLGLCINTAELSIGTALIKAFAIGLGFTLSMTLFAKLKKTVDEEAVPKAFRGFPIVLLTAGMICLALLALCAIKIG